MIVEHGEGGAKAAAPIARDIMRKALELDPAGGGPHDRGRGRSRASGVSAAAGHGCAPAELALAEKLRQLTGRSSRCCC